MKKKNSERKGRWLWEITDNTIINIKVIFQVHDLYIISHSLPSLSKCFCTKSFIYLCFSSWTIRFPFKHFLVSLFFQNLYLFIVIRPLFLASVAGAQQNTKRPSVVCWPHAEVTRAPVALLSIKVLTCLVSKTRGSKPVCSPCVSS